MGTWEDPVGKEFDTPLPDVPRYTGTHGTDSTGTGKSVGDRLKDLHKGSATRNSIHFICGDSSCHPTLGTRYICTPTVSSVFVSGPRSTGLQVLPSCGPVLSFDRPVRFTLDDRVT